MATKVLVVDDDVVIVKLVEKLLGRKGYEVFTAMDGLDALAKINDIKPDIVILDVMMPEINGYDVCYQLRFNSDFKQVPIILLTQRDNEMPDEIGKRTNIEHVRKPVNVKILVEKIRLLLGES